MGGGTGSGSSSGITNNALATLTLHRSSGRLSHQKLLLQYCRFDGSVFGLLNLSVACGFLSAGSIKAAWEFVKRARKFLSFSASSFLAGETGRVRDRCFLCGHPRSSSDGCERLFDRAMIGSDIKDVAPRSKDIPSPCERESPRNVTQRLHQRRQLQTRERVVHTQQNSRTQSEPVKCTCVEQIEIPYYTNPPISIPF